ncbi:hypothetical protein DXG01_013931 [Tephrocybe rancida]|nr:hypothetical protein DXG01_013931 [Tephrocybe rancida]
MTELINSEVPPETEVDKASLYTPGKQRSVPNVVAQTCHILGNQVLYRALLRSRGPDAQVLLNTFQWVLDESDVAENMRRQLIVAVQRLSKTSGLYPVCYELKDVVQESQDPIGGGGFADIYKGSFGRQVQFSKEVILWGQLSHRNILPIYGLYRFKQRLCIVAPWMENGDITAYLKLNPATDRRSLASTSYSTLDVANGLWYLHENHIVHGDLKGPNILIDEQGRACLCDFGISSICDPEIKVWTTQSCAGSKGGSMRWQAPELIDLKNDEEVQNSVFSDVYPLGCVCYEKWGLTGSIWSLMEDCWKAAPEERPTVSEIIERMTLLVQQDQRETSGGGVVAPTHFRWSKSEPPDAVSMTVFEKLCNMTLPSGSTNPAPA